MRLNREEIAARIPHAGHMVLLDEVSTWDSERIVCLSGAHRDPANPLRVGDQLSSVCAIEIAAQAMAVHGSLVAQNVDFATNAVAQKPRAGFLASVRNVRMDVARLDDVVGMLTIEATRESGDDARVLYRFDVRADERLLVSGRAAVVLQMSDPLEGLAA